MDLNRCQAKRRAPPIGGAVIGLSDLIFNGTDSFDLNQIIHTFLYIVDTANNEMLLT